MSVLNKPGPHESAHLHVTGQARYVADDLGPPGTLFALPVPSPVARGTLKDLDVSTAQGMPGVKRIVTAADIPGDNIWGPILHNEPLLADGEVHCVGQPIAVVIADSEVSNNVNSSDQVVNCIFSCRCGSCHDIVFTNLTLAC